MSLNRPILVAAATAIELRAAVAPLVENVPPLPGEGECVTIRAGARGLALLVTGVGPLNAAFSLGHVLGDIGRFQGLLHVGIGGSYDVEHLPLCAVAVANEEFYPDYGVQEEHELVHDAIGLAQAKGPEGGVWERIPLYPRTAAQALDLRPEAVEYLEQLPQTGFLTGGRVSGTEAVGLALHRRYGVLLENMEGFALALGCLRAGLPFLELRAVSNPCGVRDKALWNTRGALTALGETCARLLAT